MREALLSQPARRVVGRQAITRSMHALHLRACRFAMHRATCRADRLWVAAVLDALSAALVAACAEAAPNPAGPANVPPGPPFPTAATTSRRPAGPSAQEGRPSDSELQDMATDAEAMADFGAAIDGDRLALGRLKRRIASGALGPRSRAALLAFALDDDDPEGL